MWRSYLPAHPEWKYSHVKRPSSPRGRLRTVATLDGLVRLRLIIRRCANPECESYRHSHQLEEEGAFALPQGEFGLDVIALVGVLRHAEHRSVPEIHRELLGHGLNISQRTVTNLSGIS